MYGTRWKFSRRYVADDLTPSACAARGSSSLNCCRGAVGVHVEVLAVEVGDRFLLGGILDDDPCPSLAVGSGGCLHRDLEALFEYRALDGAIEIESLAHRTGGGQHLVRGQVQAEAHGTGACQTRVMSDRVTCSIEDGVADVRMNRPEKMNALDGALFSALVEMGEALKSDPSVRAVVLSGEGRAFCAGLDFGSFQAMAGDSERNLENVTPARGGEITNPGQQAAFVWQEIPAPVIAAVHGVALGGGFQIALGADIRIVAPDVKMSVLEVRWGLIPDMTGTQLLPKVVGLDVAKELTFTGRMIDGHEALRLGVATRVSETPLVDALAPRARDRIEEPAGRAGREGTAEPGGHGEPRRRVQGRGAHDPLADRVTEPGRGRAGLLREARSRLRRLSGQPRQIGPLAVGPDYPVRHCSRASAVPPCCVTPNE